MKNLVYYDEFSKMPPKKILDKIKPPHLKGMVFCSTPRREMKIEIVDFFPKVIKREEEYLKGHLHVYLIEQRMDLRAVVVEKVRDKWFFYLPIAWGNDHETGATVRFPIVNFTDQGVNKGLLHAIKVQGKEFILENCKEML